MFNGKIEKLPKETFFVVTLILKIDGQEKSSVALIKADTKKEAQKIALEGECHGEIEWTGEDSCEDMGNIYEVFSVKEVAENEIEVIKKYL